MNREEWNDYAAAYRVVRKAYLDGGMSDDEYLAHRAAWDANQRAFDESRGESVPA